MRLLSGAGKVTWFSLQVLRALIVLSGILEIVATIISQDTSGTLAFLGLHVVIYLVLSVLLIPVGLLTVWLDMKA